MMVPLGWKVRQMSDVPHLGQGRSQGLMGIGCLFLSVNG